MILTDFSQLCIAGYMMSIHGKAEGEIEVFRHAVLNSLRLINNKHRRVYGQLILAVDTPDSWRKKYFPYYKASRKDAQQKSAINWGEVKSWINTIQAEVDESMQWPVIKVDGAEADDIIGTLARSAKSPTLITSADKDFIQLQINNPHIKQWDSIHQRWVSHDQPARYLFEHVVRGDLGDGIPNIYSQDDHYITKPGKAKKIMQTNLDRWWNEGIAEIKDLPGFKRNMTLIDLRKTPVNIQADIAAKAALPAKNKSKVIDYLITHRLRNLTPHLGDF